MKKIIFSIIALITFLVGSSLGIYYFVDINNYKPDVVQLVKEQTGKDIIINGDMRLRLLPDIAIDISRISMPSPKSGGVEDAFYVKQIILHLRIFPLFKKEIEVSSISMLNPEIRYTIFQDGTNNFSAPVQPVQVDKKDKKNNPAENIAEEKPFDNYAAVRELVNSYLVDRFDFSKVVARSGKFIFADERKGVVVSLKDVELETSLTPEFNPIKMSANIEAPAGVNVPFTFAANYQLLKDKYEISGIEAAAGIINTHAEFMADFRSLLPEYKFTVYFEDMDLTPYSGLVDLVLSSFVSKKEDSKPAQELKSINNRRNFEKASFWSEAPIDFMDLRKFNANLNFKSNKVVYKDTNVGSITIYAYLINGKLTFSVKEAELFNGNINSDITIDVTSSTPKIKYKLNLEEVDLSLVPANLIVLNKFSGKAHGGTMLTSHGVSMREIIANLNGSTSLKAEEGFIKDIDLIAMAKNDNGAFDVKANKNSKTDFKEISGDFEINSGTIRTENIELNSDILDFGGSGTSNLNEMSISMMLNPKVKRTKDGKDILSGVRAPILVSGNVLEPSYRLEIQTLVEDVIKNPKATENLVKQLKRDFKDIKNNMRSDESDNKGGGFFDDIKNVLKGF